MTIIRFDDPEMEKKALDCLVGRYSFKTWASGDLMIRGQWQHQREVYEDELVRLFVDVEDHPENRQFFLEFKQRLKARFQQIDLWPSDLRKAPENSNALDERAAGQELLDAHPALRYTLGHDSNGPVRLPLSRPQTFCRHPIGSPPPVVLAHGAVGGGG